MMSRAAFLAVVAVGLGGCGGGVAGPVDGGGGGPDLTPGIDAGSDAAGPCASTAVVVSGAFPSPLGGVNTVALADRSAHKGLDNTIDTDSVVRAAGGKVYVLNRTKGVLRIYDPAAGFAGPIDIVTGDGTIGHELTDPTDVLPIAGTTRSYVAAYMNDADHALGVVDSSQPGKGVVKWIALPASGKTNLPRPTQLWSCKGLVYVLLEDLDASFKLTGPGRIAIVDPARDALVSDGQPSVIPLLGSNPGGGLPYGMTAVGGDCTQVLVADAGDLSGASQDLGGIERIDLNLRQSLGMILVGATDLKGNVGAIAAASPTCAYAVVGAFANKVVAFDPTAKQLLGDVLGPASYVPFVQVSCDGQVFVGVNASMQGQVPAGLHVGPATCAPLTGAPITFDQPPYGIAFF